MCVYTYICIVKIHKTPFILHYWENLCISIIFVKFLGIIGVAIGTLVAMTFRTVYQIIYLHHHILKRRIIHLFHGISCYTLGMIAIIYVSSIIFQKPDDTILGWIFYAVKNSILAFTLLGIISAFIYQRNKRKVIKI